MKKIAIIIQNLNGGGAERTAANLSLYFSEKYVEYAEYGILVSVGNNEHCNPDDPLTKDEEQLSKAIVMLLTDTEKRKNYEAKALERAKDFSPDVIMQKWKRLL